MLFYLVVRFGGVALERCPRVIDQLIGTRYGEYHKSKPPSTDHWVQYFNISNRFPYFAIWIIWSTAWGRINQWCLLVSHKQKSNTLYENINLLAKRTAQLHLSNLFERGLAVLDCYILKLLKSFTENITLITHWESQTWFTLPRGPMASLHEWSEVTGGGFREMGVTSRSSRLFLNFGWNKLKMAHHYTQMRRMGFYMNLP